VGDTSLSGAQIRYLIRSPGGVLGAMGFSAAAWKAAGRDEAPELAQIEFDMPKTEQRKAQRLRAVRGTLKAPYRTGHKLPDVEVTALLAQEIDPPAGLEPIE